MVRHKFTYEGREYDIRANDYVEFPTFEVT